MEENNIKSGKVLNNDRIGIPGAIVAAGIIIAVAIIYTSSGKGTVTSDNPPTNQEDIVAAQNEQKKKMADNLKPVSAKDHILGNPNAPVKIVEFSDIECPFCKRFHPTMQRIMDEYGKDGKVAWVYRHFPLQIHPKATLEAHATECAAEQGGNDMFWKYTDRLIELSLTNNQTDPVVMTQIAEELGLDIAKFTACQDSGKYADLIQANIDDGLAAGVSGTPYTIVIAPNGNKYPISGAFPYETVRDTVEIALEDI